MDRDIDIDMNPWTLTHHNTVMGADMVTARDSGTQEHSHGYGQL
jgi:hypothetical protein